MRRALDLGINFFDTAQAYGFGTSEQIVGKALEPEIKSRREEVVLATKGGLRMEGDQLLRDSSPEWLRQGVEDSLRFLGTDYIDLYQVHWPDLDTPFEETAGALDELVEEGKIRYVEEEILPYCAEHGIEVLVYGPLAHGLLSGKMSPDQELAEDDWRSQSDL